jgi:hypothetical protein
LLALASEYGVDEATARVLISSSADGHHVQRRRGLPMIGPGCGGGASPGTDPVRALLGKESRRR